MLVTSGARNHTYARIPLHHIVDGMHRPHRQILGNRYSFVIRIIERGIRGRLIDNGHLCIERAVKYRVVFAPVECIR